MLSIFLVLHRWHRLPISPGENSSKSVCAGRDYCRTVIFALGMFDLFMIQVPSSIAQMGVKKRSGLTGDFNGMFAHSGNSRSGPLLGATSA